VTLTLMSRGRKGERATWGVYAACSIFCIALRDFVGMRFKFTNFTFHIVQSVVNLRFKLYNLCTNFTF
jgi:hypothetical protein